MVTRHLRPDELSEAAESRAFGHDAELSPGSRAHLADCATCAARVAAARSLLALAAAASSVPEPSPLFWDHLSARVRQATAAEPVQGASAWPARIWAPLLAGSLAFVLMVTAVVLRRGEEAAGPSERSTEAAVAAAAETPVFAVPEEWDDVMAVASDLSSEDVDDIAPWSDSPVSLLAELTPEERDVFVGLLEREMAGQR